MQTLKNNENDKNKNIIKNIKNKNILFLELKAQNLYQSFTFTEIYYYFLFIFGK